MYDKALIYADSAINLLSGVSDNNGLDYRIKRQGYLLTQDGQMRLFPYCVICWQRKTPFYQHLSTSQMEEIYEMKKIDELLLKRKSIGQSFKQSNWH